MASKNCQENKENQATAREKKRRSHKATKESRPPTPETPLPLGNVKKKKLKGIFEKGCFSCVDNECMYCNDNDFL